MAFDLDIDVPLLIGTIPLRSTFSNFAQPSGTPLGPHGTPMANPSAPPMGFVDPSRGMAPPPAYQYHQPPFATTYPDIRECGNHNQMFWTTKLAHHIAIGRI